MKPFFLAFFLFCFASSGAQQLVLEDFIANTDQFLRQHVVDGLVDYEKAKANSNKIDVLVEAIAQLQLERLSDDEKIAFYINAYNVIVINEVLKVYPLPSVQEVGGFFTRQKHMVAGESMTLNYLENNRLLKQFPDARYHFVLVCGAIDCPRIKGKAIYPNMLDRELERASKKALNSDYFVKKNGNAIGLSEIFKWYPDDFGSSRSDVIKFINRYRNNQISEKDKTFYYDYNWTLNDVKSHKIAGQSFEMGNNSFRYVTSAAITKGGLELKIFNNLYSQNDGNRSTYFTSAISFLYGYSNRLNIGFAGRYRRVLNASGDSSPLDIFSGFSAEDGRQRISAFGPQIRWAPFKKIQGLSFQSSLTIPIGNGLDGSNGGPFLDWNGPVFVTQMFYDRSIGDKFSVFTEVDLLAEEIGGKSKDNRVSIPITSIFSWYPKKNVTLYGLAVFSPYAVIPFDYFTQLGLGFKYQLTPNFELELLATSFSNRYLNGVDGDAATYNFGVRYSN